jgi:hypothetical protein
MADTSMPDEPSERLGKLLRSVIAARSHDQATPGRSGL